MTAEDTINKYFPYLLEIRKRLLLAVSVMLVSGFLGFFYYDRIVAAMVKMLQLDGINIVFTSPFQYVELAMSSALLIGLVSAIPFVIWQLLSFLKPALKDPEYRLVVFMLPLALVLFAAGFAFGVLMMKYVVVLFQASATKLNIGNYLDVSALLTAIITTSSLMGLAFQFPLVLTALVHFKAVKYAWLAKQRPWAYLSSFIFSIMLPPTDVLSDVLLTLPLVILFELTLILNRLLLKSHQRG
ncbi:MAG: Twin arginine targeting protein translocase subunit TatC [Candidatus Amesbacteria bacterium GW2011_GWA2_47_11b]|uniref:Sec-independent protein translocase protein TatC n=3 Tax=Candidatus Amesiibacteriota TaxID=1752730 RepID=A0A0G1UR92_9BACT|nr:MAG: sec-independent protein translocase, TatC subunit, sec-independent protein translocase protein TatC [Microgenomates group bacterium GW2011_GWC1_46_20]KKU57392.1 MAG: Twin arginine targeting protein translocase subunit TatC [Candidatus Amesbacteria bacterium GW2011_GWA2_47_11b]KKU68573.1 MAG: Twin arginine targeting protein translocase subunit TatC [Candidatus Amesbacteria bacterium GW2011_GWA1_47_20]KKU82951.1 MAG: Twin arginine targeting protein translocase subunit TatC [Candidatus Ames